MLTSAGAQPTDPLADARRLNDEGRHVQALDAARASAEAAEREQGGRSRAALEARQVEAQTLFLLGRHREALAVAHAVHEARAATLGSTHLDTLRSLNTIAACELQLGLVAKAADTFAAIAGGLDAADPAAAAFRLQARNNQGAALIQLGRYAQAEPILEDVLEERRDRLGPEDPATLATLRNVVQAKRQLGKVSAALTLGDEAMPAHLRRLGPSHAGTLRLEIARAQLLVDLARYDEAGRVAQAVAAQLEALPGDRRAAIAEARYVLALSLLLAGRDAQARPILDALVATPAPEGEGAPALRLDIRYARAFLVLKGGDAKRAAAEIEAVASDARTALPADDPERLRFEAGVARVMLATGRAAEAAQRLEEVYAAKRSTLGESHPETLVTLATLAHAQLADGRDVDAEASLERFAAGVERRDRDSPLPMELRQSAASRWIDEGFQATGYKALAFMRARRGDAQGALAAAGRVKARTLVERLALRPESEGGVLAEDEARALRELALREAALDRALPGAVDADLRARLAAERLQLARESARRLAQARERHPALDALLTNPVDAATAARRLAKDAVFIEFLGDADRLLAFVLEPTGALRAVELGTRPGLVASVAALRRLAASAMPEGEPVWLLADGTLRWSLSRPAGEARRLASAAAGGQALGRWLFGPLAPVIHRYRQWIIAPDGALALLPFDLLTDGGREVLLVQSLAAMARAHEARPSRATNAALLVGDVAYEEGDASLRPLVASRREIDAIARSLGATPVTRLTGSDASAAHIRSLAQSGALGRFRYIHFAAHASLAVDDPALSALVLGAADASSPGGRSITASEISGWRLHGDLVTLSACDTGRGRIVAGEGILGLPLALTLAGARQALLTLWPVADEAAARFMPRFYARLARGAAPAAALRETQREFALSGGAWSAPRHWAAYALYGVP